MAEEGSAIAEARPPTEAGYGGPTNKPASDRLFLRDRQARQSFLKRQCCLILRPVDDLEHHSPFDHFGLEFGSVLFPVRCFADTETSLLVLLLKRVVGYQSAADALVHHGKAFVRERLIIHLIPNEKARARYTVCL